MNFSSKVIQVMTPDTEPRKNKTKQQQQNENISSNARERYETMLSDEKHLLL
jgi:hypothetical protein